MDWIATRNVDVGDGLANCAIAYEAKLFPPQSDGRRPIGLKFRDTNIRRMNKEIHGQDEWVLIYPETARQIPAR